MGLQERLGPPHNCAHVQAFETSGDVYGVIKIMKV